MLQDNYGRRFHYLRMSITDVCNFRCTYCLPDGYQGGNRSFISVHEVETIAKAFAGLGTSKIRVTGGEPSLRKDLANIIEVCADTKGIKQVAMTSNGFKLETEVDTWYNAGLNSINISIDSFDPFMFHRITGHAKLDSILRGINRALELGIEVKINAVLMKQYNANQMLRFLNWVKIHPITVRFIELMQTGDNATFFRNNHVSGEPIKKDLLAQGWEQVGRDIASGPAQEFQHPDYKGRIGLIMPYSKDFCSTCNRLRISALGKLHLCLFSDDGLDLRSYMSDGDYVGLQHALIENLSNKNATHYLHQGLSGATTHLAMLGG